ncbi:hypothetical protein C8R43DRAFT_954250 [Mycena crocata]|nr:hypothetical protein C8R43DRAFT_954250 [Mycena crocata]
MTPASETVIGLVGVANVKKTMQHQTAAVSQGRLFLSGCSKALGLGQVVMMHGDEVKAKLRPRLSLASITSTENRQKSPAPGCCFLNFTARVTNTREKNGSCQVPVLVLPQVTTAVLSDFVNVSRRCHEERPKVGDERHEAAN